MEPYLIPLLASAKVAGAPYRSGAFFRHAEAAADPAVALP